MGRGSIPLPLEPDVQSFLDAVGDSPLFFLPVLLHAFIKLWRDREIQPDGFFFRSLRLATAFQRHGVHLLSGSV